MNILKKPLLFYFGLGLICSSFSATATTMYLVAPAETNPNDPYVLSVQGLNHSLELASYVRGNLIPDSGLNDPYFLTANPEYMRSNTNSNSSCINWVNTDYLSNPQTCYFDTTPFATLDPTVIYYNKLIHDIDPTLSTYLPQKLYPSSAHSLTDFIDLKSDLVAAEPNHSTIILSWPRPQLNDLILSLTNCAIPSGFNGNPGQIIKMNLNGTTCTNSPTLIQDKLMPSTAFPNILNQYASVTGHLATSKDKYVIFLRHGEKWDLMDATGGELSCIGLNRALAVAYYAKQKYGIPDVILGASLTKQASPPLPVFSGSSWELAPYASRVLEKITPYAVLTGIDIKVLPVDLKGNQLQSTITNLVNNSNNKLIIVAWESANAARIADAIILNSWNIQTNTNNPFYWDGNDYEQNLVLHYHCTSSSSCALQNDYYINDEDYGNDLPSWCGIPANS